MLGSEPGPKRHEVKKKPMVGHISTGTGDVQHYVGPILEFLMKR